MIRKLIISSYIVVLSLLALVGVASFRIYWQLEKRNEAIEQAVARRERIEVLLAAMNQWRAARTGSFASRSSAVSSRAMRMEVWQVFLTLEPRYDDLSSGRTKIERIRQNLRILLEDDSETGPDEVRHAHLFDDVGVALADLVRAEVTMKESAATAFRMEARRAVLLLACVVIVTLGFLFCSIVVAHMEAARRSVARKDLRRTNAELEQRISEQERRATELEIMTGLGDQLQVCSTLTESQRVIDSYLPTLFQSASGVVYVARRSNDAPELLCEWGFDRPSLPLIESCECWAIRSGRAYVSGPDQPSIPCAHLADPSQPSICIPMHSDGETMGVLHLAGRTGPPDEQVARSVAKQLSLGLANIRLRESLRLRAIRDPLTNLFNRRYLEESLSREVQRASRQKSTFAVAMIDVDHFKAFNDSFGHAAGDTVLQGLADLMQSVFRDEDVVCRFGGEEFTVVLTDTTLEVAASRVEQLRKEVKNLAVKLDGSATGRVTISAGLAAYPLHGHSKDSLIATADRMLYRAKAEGRDRVVLADATDPLMEPRRSFRIVNHLESA